jgi:hypothetical protein
MNTIGRNSPFFLLRLLHGTTRHNLNTGSYLALAEGFIEPFAMPAQARSSQEHPTSLLRQSPALVRPRSSDSTIDASQEGQGGRICKVESVTASAFRSPPRSTVSPSLEMMWQIRRCDAFDEGSDDDEDEIDSSNLAEEGWTFVSPRQCP